MLRRVRAEDGQARLNGAQQDLSSVGFGPGSNYIQAVFQELNLAHLLRREFGVDGAFAARLVAQVASTLLPIRPIHSI